MSEGKDPRRQHLVPNFYLRRFSGEGGRIAVVNRVTGARHVGATDNVMVERDFYAYESVSGGISYDIEKRLAGVEGAGGAAIKRIVAGYFDPSPADRTALAAFMAFQLVRSRKVRRQQEMNADAYQKALLRGMDEGEIKLRLDATGRPATDSEVRATVESLTNLDDHEFVPTPEDHLRTMLHVAERLFPTLLAMRIDVVEWGARRLLTSDHPIVYFKRNPHPLMGYGLENCDQVWFPVDPKHVIVMSHRGPVDPPERVVQGTAEFAEEVNYLVAWHAYEWIVMHPDDDHLADLKDFKYEALPFVEVLSDAGLPDLAALGEVPRRRSPRRVRKRRGAAGPG